MSENTCPSTDVQYFLYLSERWTSWAPGPGSCLATGKLLNVSVSTSLLNVLLQGQSNKLQQESSVRQVVMSRSREYRSHTFAHVADAFLEDVVAMAIHMGAQEVLEAVVDLQPGTRHAHPLTHRVAFEVLQVLDALDHLLVLLSIFCGPLHLAALPGRALLILLIAVWGKRHSLE